MGGICVDNKRAGNALAVGIVKVVIIEQAVNGRFKSIGFGKNDRKRISVWIEHQLKRSRFAIDGVAFGHGTNK